MPAYSIIIPVYNASHHLEECLLSVVSQLESDFELIVVNDGSTDNSLDILMQFKAKYKNIIVINQQNQGMSVARNAALRISKGDYVLFVDSDDILEKNALDTLKKHINNQDMICFNAQILFETTDGVKSYDSDEGIVENFEKGWDYFNKYAGLNSKIHFVCVWQRTYRKEFLSKNNLFFAEGISRGEDDLFTSIACYYAEKVTVISDLLYTYRVHRDGITLKPNPERMFQSFLVLEKMTDFFVSKQNITKSIIYKILVSAYINLFSKKAAALYGDYYQDVINRVNYKKFKKIAITVRHRLLYYVVRINPNFYRYYETLINKMRRKKYAV